LHFGELRFEILGEPGNDVLSPSFFLLARHDIAANSPIEQH
jgi:hypothetical protein